MIIYYLIASLPTLQFGGKLPFSVEEFLAECRRLLSSETFKIIDQALGQQEKFSSQPTLRAWQEFNRCLRNEWAWFRATEANEDPALFLRGERKETDPVIFDAITTAAQAGDPLSAENILDSLLWRKLEELSLFHYFDVDQLIIYGLKLKILERYCAIASPRGREKFAQLKAAAAEKFV